MLGREDAKENEFPYPLTSVHGAEAEGELVSLMRAGRLEGFSPVLIGDTEEVARVVEHLKFDKRSVEEILDAAKRVVPEEWFETQRQELGEEDEEGEVYEAAEATERLTVAYEVLSGKPHEKVFIARIPTVNSWEIPAYLKAGGWNECPNAEVQVAISKQWNALYDAQIASMSGDVVEYLVGKPPKDRKAADALAKEQYLYCADIVWQGVGSVKTLSKVLQGSPYWYFWWD
jgi:hypothetical protein